MQFEFIKEKNKKRLVSNFLKLVKIYSPTLKEGKIAAELIKILKKLRCTVSVDSAGKKTGGETGNIIARLKGNIKSAPLVLCAHMDMVEPCKNIKSVIKKDKILSDGKTISGADCRGGIAIILEILTILKEKKLSHPPLEIVFTIAEEGQMLGSKNLDYSKLKAKNALMIDTEFASCVTVKGPAKEIVNITINGVSSHAGIYPERGLSAIEIAGDLIKSLKLGRIDKDTTVNLGTITGGKAVGVVPAEVKIKGEVRSFSNLKLKKQINLIKQACKKTEKNSRKKVDGKIISAKIKCETESIYPCFNTPLNSPIIKALQKTAKKQNIKLAFIKRSSGGDTSIFNANNITACNLGCGQKHAHTTRSYLELNEFLKAAETALEAVLNFKD